MPRTRMPRLRGMGIAHFKARAVSIQFNLQGCFLGSPLGNYKRHALQPEDEGRPRNKLGLKLHMKATCVYFHCNELLLYSKIYSIHSCAKSSRDRGSTCPAASEAYRQTSGYISTLSEICKLWFANVKSTFSRMESVSTESSTSR